MPVSPHIITYPTNEQVSTLELYVRQQMERIERMLHTYSTVLIKYQSRVVSYYALHSD